MSEEILEALTKLFALTTMQEGGTSETEKEFVLNYFKTQLTVDAIPTYILKYEEAAAEFGAKKERRNKDKEDVAVAELDEEEKIPTEEELDRAFQKFSVKVLGQCRKINQTLTQNQKILVLVKITELLAIDGRATSTPRRVEVVKLIAESLQITKPQFELIYQFITKQPNELLTLEDILTIGSDYVPSLAEIKRIQVPKQEGTLIFAHINEANMYFVRYTGSENIKLNDFRMQRNAIYSYADGSIIRTQQGKSFYYSDVTSNFLSSKDKQKLSFNAMNIEFKFPNGALGLRNVSVAEGAGKLIGIMGASGAGKTTLLNVLAGLEAPSSGSVLINGLDIHKQKELVQGVVGYVAQDDLLIEELSVYQNLYYNTKLCFKSFTEKQLEERVLRTLSDLGLDHIKHLKVGNPLEKTISGGQRKRLNIALELIREPVVLFLDEPTSGLSSRDSENVLDLLKELSLRGKLIFVVIHQPSSEIFKMFDKLIILDTGGYQAYYGNPVDAVIYFKTQSKQVKAEEGQCGTCGSVNPEQIFDIIEAKVINEAGKFTKERKTKPPQWNHKYFENFTIEPAPQENEAPPKALDLPSKAKQTVIFTVRDFLSKIANKQYVMINLLEAPLLAGLLAFIIRFANNPASTDYTYRFNENVPAYILISVLVALFMGLTVSAEEIIKDRKIQKRETFLNLNRNSYLFSKLIILFSLSAVQTLTFVLVGNLLLGIQWMNTMYWLVLFSVSCFANMLGLNISSTFSSVVTIYITIPLLLIPQMILSGIIFNFNNLNSFIGDKGQVPFVADFMVTRWGFEAIAVEQFKSNLYQKPYFDSELEESMSDYRRSYWTDEMKNTLGRANGLRGSTKDADKVKMAIEIDLLSREIARERNTDALRASDVPRPALTKFEKLPEMLTPANFNQKVSEQTDEYLEEVRKYYRKRFNTARNAKQNLMEERDKGGEDAKRKDDHFNESLSDLVRNANLKGKIIYYKQQLLQQIDPIFHDPSDVSNPFDYRTHFLAPKKQFLGGFFGTYYFNICVIWMMSIFLYVTLYFDALRKLFSFLGSLKERFSKKLKK